jgi:prevent-host-death family protein
MAKATKDFVTHPAASASLDSSSTLEVPAGVFKNTCLALMDRVHDERIHVVITKHGKPVARLVPANVEAPSALGFMRGTVVAAGDIVSPDFDAWGDL